MKSFLYSGSSITTTGTDRFIPVALIPSFVQGLEVLAADQFGIAGTFSKLRVVITTNVAATGTFTFRKNTSDGNQTISVGSGATGVFEDAVNTDVVDADDSISIRCLRTGGAILTGNNFGIAFVPDAAISYLRYGNISGSLNAGTTYYFAGAGVLVPNTTESVAQTKVISPFTWKLLSATIQTNTLDVISTIKTRINGADGTQSLSIPAGTTGYFSDTTNDDTVVVDDLIDIQFAIPAGTGNLVGNVLSGFESANLVFQYLNKLATTLTQAVTYYTPFYQTNTSGTVEANAQYKFPVTATASLLGVNVTSNGVSDTTTVKLRINGVDGNQVLSIGAGLTGEFIDITNTDSLVTDDLICLQTIVGAGGTSIVVNANQLLIEGVAAASGKSKTFIGLVA